MTTLTSPYPTPAPAAAPMAGAPAPHAAAEQSPRLTVTKATVLRHLKVRIEQGMTIRRQRIRYAEDLEEVRQKKAEWVQAYTDLLLQAFHGDAGAAVVDSCNNWVGRVYPEYADMELFVEQFYDEMDYRISRLKVVARQVSGMAEPVPVPRPTPASNTPEEHVKSTLMDAAPESPAPAAAVKGKPALPAAPVTAASAQVAPTPVMETTPVPVVAPAEPLSSGLFVVHGGSPQAAESVRRFLRDLGIDLLALPATPAANKTLVGTLEQGPGASFAVILLNPEDSAALRAPGTCRPAITFQLGYFVGRLGLPRVCVLCEGGSDVFHDEHGILCLPLDAANGWHLQLARHLKRAGIEVDLNKLC